MEKNARVDVLGRSHEGKQIYRVVVDGKEKPMYMVDASCDTVDEEGKSLFTGANVTGVNCVPEAGLIADAPPQKEFSEQWYQTAGVLIELDNKFPEPVIKGDGPDGINRAWLIWYRNQTPNTSLVMAIEEAKRRIQQSE